MSDTIAVVSTCDKGIRFFKELKKTNMSVELYRTDFVSEYYLAESLIKELNKDAKIAKIVLIKNSYDFLVDHKKLFNYVNYHDERQEFKNNICELKKILKNNCD